MRGQTGIWLRASIPTVQAMVAAIITIITENITHPWRGRPTIPAVHHRTPNGKSIMPTHWKLAKAVGFSKGWVESTRKSAAIGGQSLHRRERGQGADHANLLFWLALIGGAHRGRLQGRHLIAALIGHRRALPKKSSANTKEIGTNM